MRYSMLVWITKMGRTLLEAVQYLKTAPEGGLRVELLDNGRQMLAQIRAVLEGHRDDLHSGSPLDKLSEIEGGWPEQRDGLETELEQFIRCLPDTVAYQVRAVFFAELGEKWDSMESVYEYMRDDPRFDPVVVRTPVGRVVERDGKREQEIIYKDFLTPMGIPSLGYDRYSLEEDCPELAFISQPYESCTPPQFWPENIAEHTRLVYLPYGLQGAVFESFIESHCQLPVFRYAWKTVGMSERWYRFYCKHARNKGSNMLVTGLPKTDPVIRLRDYGFPVPGAWKPAVEGRKVILWNTRYNFSTSSIDYFDRLTAWLEAHEDCAIIWRPHPMTEVVTKLYYPDTVYRAFQSYVRRTKELPNMVYDEEAGFQAAFACSDAQIADYSTMMFQYLLLDKPVCWLREREGEFGALTGEYFVDCGWMEQTYSADETINFLDRIRTGQDKNSGLRKKTIKTDLALADGRCGERLCNALWDAMHREDGI